jgi:hypothetical protein
MSTFKTVFFVCICAVLFSRCSQKSTTTTRQPQPVHQDYPFWQDYSVKFYAQPTDGVLLSAYSDRNNVIKILTDKGLTQPYDGHFLYHGKLQPDGTYRPLKNKKISAIGVYEQQFVFLDDKTVLSNSWAGKLFSKHQLPNARLFEGGANFTFLVSDGKSLVLTNDSKQLWQGNLPSDEALQIHYQASTNTFWVLGRQGLYTLQNNLLTKVFNGNNLTTFTISSNHQKVIIGTTDGYLEWDIASKKQIGDIHKKLPWTEITAVSCIGDKVWFGTTNGAFALRTDGKFDYYNGERWLPNNQVVHISEGPNQSVLVLTKGGLGQICFKKMTLHEKAMYYEQQVRSRHIRNGFNASLTHMEKGNIGTGYLADSDNDGLWTSMYLGGEVYRYAVTKDPEALQNCREAFDAMERLYSVNPVKGFPSRSYERSGFISQLADPERWQHSADPEWDWKATTSSDEAVGHIFAFGAMAELIDDPSLKQRAIVLIDSLMGHIVQNNYYLIDYDGKPTTWGRWSPEYVNAMPKNVGDRKITSSNIVAMLQTAYHFTKKEIYKEKAFELMHKHGYFENLMRPMKEIGSAPDDADALSKELSDGWNHSDDEMYFVCYWGLYRYAFNDTLKAHFKEAIVDHWQIERPEKEGAWNIFTALIGVENFDLKEAVWYLQEHPLDLIDWAIANSHRKDIEKLAPNFRNQTIQEVLPPDERPVQRHNANMFNLDRKGGNGTSEHSAGDIWLLPYWLGRYLGVISEPKK